MNCITCNNELSGRQSKFCSKLCKSRHSGNSYSNQKERSLRRKKEFIHRLGNCCSNCGYNRNIAALEFHHKNNKSFKMDSRRLSNTSQDKLEIELKKCILLCANCHRELHYPHLFSHLLSI